MNVFETKFNTTLNDIISEQAEAIGDLQEDVEDNALLILENLTNITSVKSENLEQNKVLEDLEPLVPSANYLLKLEKIGACSKKYIEAFNKISYIGSYIKVELTYNLMGFPDGIIINTIKHTGGWFGYTVIMPVKGITEYSVWPLESLSNLISGWTEHYVTDEKLGRPNYHYHGYLNYDKSIGIWNLDGGLYGRSATSSQAWIGYKADDNLKFKTPGHG